MTAAKIHPLTRSGAWQLVGGYRRRAVRALDLAEEHLRAVLAVREPGSKVVTRQEAELIHDAALCRQAAMLFAVMAVESFLNHYGVVRLGEAFYTENLERLALPQKLCALVATCCGKLLDDGDEIVLITRRLYKRRNSMVHPKTYEAGSRKARRAFDFEHPRVAKQSVTDMQRFFELFHAIDPAAEGKSHFV